MLVLIVARREQAAQQPQTFGYKSQNRGLETRINNMPFKGRCTGFSKNCLIYWTCGIGKLILIRCTPGLNNSLSEALWSKSGLASRIECLAIEFCRLTQISIHFGKF